MHTKKVLIFFKCFQITFRYERRCVVSGKACESGLGQLRVPRDQPRVDARRHKDFDSRKIRKRKRAGKKGEIRLGLFM